MVSSILRFIRRRAAAAGISRSGSRMMTTTTTTTSPWLTLPEEGGAYKFYSLADDKVVTIRKQPPPATMAKGRMKLIGSSHGWLASINLKNKQILLSNPISGRHIQLPDVSTVHIHSSQVSKLLLSHSPTAAGEDCRAVVRLESDGIGACCPGRSTEWIPFSEHASYKSLAYSSRRRRLFSISYTDDLDCFDLTDPDDPDVAVKVANDAWDILPEVRRATGADYGEIYLYLVVEELSDRLFVVARRVLDQTGGGDELNLKRTVWFEVYEMDWGGKIKGKMEGSLDGLAMFVGKGQGFAVAAAAAEVKPDSIYFTSDEDKYVFEAHDVGVFDYVDKKISSLYYSFHVANITPPPLWFTPTP